MFTLNDRQRGLLAAAGAWLEEGERRFDHWSRRQTLTAGTDAFGQTLAESGLRAGRALPAATRVRLLHLAAALAPNPNLSRRLYQNDPAGFDRRLRTLLFGETPLDIRLREFLAVRGTGILTASQLLCAFAPGTYPLVTRPALRRLQITPAQMRDALADAAAHYGFAVPSGEPPDAAQRLLALFIAFQAVRAALPPANYAEIDDLLRTGRSPGALPAAADASQVREAPDSSYVPSPPPTETVMLGAMEDYVLSHGFVFPPLLLRSYYIALKTKPFVLLSGVSGSGKTKLAELFAEALTGHQPAQFRLIPVRPDWSDSTPLFGYQNVLANRYVSTPFLDLLRTAALPENRNRAFFVCLDEMNLARVEQYLADYLSALEARARRVPLQGETADLILPTNFFVTGTVNVDETTHAFSRKVLDRANTLDFDSMPHLSGGLIGAGSKGIGSLEDDLSPSSDRRQALFLGARITLVGRARERLSRIDERFPERALAVMEGANERLYPHRLHFAYRVRDEILLFLANSFDAETGQGLLVPDAAVNFAQALDLQIGQKVLPKIQGLAETLDSLLASLLAWAQAENLPRAAAKLARMRAHGEATGYIRFYE